MSSVNAFAENQCSSDVMLKVYDDNKLPTESTNSNATNFLQLNEYCLLEIFAVKSLSLMDLCSLADTCTRFQQISQRVFPMGLSIEIRPSGYRVVASGKYLPIKKRPQQDIRNIFKNFGSFLSDVSIASTLSRTSRSSEDPSRFVLNLVTEYCGDDLASLKIKYLNIPAVLAVKLKPIFKRLQILELTLVDVVGDRTLFADLNTLIELRVSWVDNSSAILENIFPKLERFSYGQRDIEHFTGSLSIFIVRHPSLRSLDINSAVGKIGMKLIMQSIIGLQLLEKLSINMSLAPASVFLRPLQKLKSLEALSLHGMSCKSVEYIAALTELRELHLNYCILPHDSNLFSIWTQLTKLYIRDEFNYNFFDVVDIIRQLVNLEELAVSMKLKEKEFSEIVAIVRDRPKVLTLKCKFNFAYDSSQVDNEKVKLIRIRGRFLCVP